MGILLVRLVPDFLALVILLFLAAIIEKNLYFSGKKENLYLKSIYLTSFNIIMEIVYQYFGYGEIVAYRIPYLISVAVGFFMAPWTCVYITFGFAKTKLKLFQYSTIPFLIFSMLVILSIFNGCIFYISPTNTYTRGPLFLAYPLIALYNMFLFTWQLKGAIKKYDQTEKKYFYMLCCLVFFGILTQVLLPNMLTAWPSITIALTFYYIFTREMQHKYDSLTGSHNRYAYQQKLRMLLSETKATICFLDLNHLKKVNDTYGHEYGDRYLKRASRIMEECFFQYGEVYRVGGDEFCIICPGITEDSVEPSIQCFEMRILEERKKFGSLFSIAYGVAYWDKDSGETIDQCISRADQLMYLNKREFKKKEDQNNEKGE